MYTIHASADPLKADDVLPAVAEGGNSFVAKLGPATQVQVVAEVEPSAQERQEIADLCDEENPRKSVGRGRNRHSGPTEQTSCQTENRPGPTDNSTPGQTDNSTDVPTRGMSAYLRGGVSEGGGTSNPTPHPRASAAEDPPYPPEIAKVLEEYADVFPAVLPLGLPPSRPKAP